MNKMTVQKALLNKSNHQETETNPDIYKLVSILIVSAFFLVACDSTFNPWQENDQYYFSIYGYLDTSADTQWVRVMPVREDFYLEPQTSNATVTLEHLETGNTVVMNDSLVPFAHGVYAYNFWTTMKPLPEQTYRITATRPDGKFSSSQITLPKDYPTPLVLGVYSGSNSTISSYTVTLAGINNLADVQTVYRCMGIPHLQDTTRATTGDLRVTIDVSEDRKILELIDCSPSNGKIFIASGGPEYVHFGSVNELVIPLPDGVSNISNGVGYLAGIISKTIPIKSCLGGETGNVFVPCELEPYPW